MRALVLDDSKAMRMILKGILKDFGYECMEAGNGQEALDKLAEVEPPPLALVDWNMPVMNGFEFLKQLRANKRYDETKVVMVTTESEMENIQAALAAGANDYAMKPFEKSALKMKLEMIIGD